VEFQLFQYELEPVWFTIVLRLRLLCVFSLCFSSTPAILCPRINFLCFLVYFILIVLSLVAFISAADFLDRLVSEMTGHQSFPAKNFVNSMCPFAKFCV